MEQTLLPQGLATEDLARFLAACYYQPEEHLAEEQVFAALAEAAGVLAPDLHAGAVRLGDAFAAATLDDLRLDYSRLFLGPFEILAKPYGSVWLEGEKVVMGESTMALLELYRSAGFDLDEDFRELPDHIAAELEFLYLLNFQINEARRAGDDAGAAQAVAWRRILLRDHLGRWIVPFAAALRAGAQTPFYRHLADLTALFILKEATLGAE